MDLTGIVRVVTVDHDTVVKALTLGWKAGGGSWSSGNRGFQPWGPPARLAVGGEEGVAQVLAALRDELDLAMALAGCASVGDVMRDLVER